MVHPYTSSYQKMKKVALYVYYLAFSLVILVHGLRNPYHNWDLIGYIASAKYYTVQDKEALFMLIGDRSTPVICFFVIPYWA